MLFDGYTWLTYEQQPMDDILVNPQRLSLKNHIKEESENVRTARSLIPFHGLYPIYFDRGSLILYLVYVNLDSVSIYLVLRLRTNTEPVNHMLEIQLILDRLLTMRIGWIHSML